MNAFEALPSAPVQDSSRSVTGQDPLADGPAAIRLSRVDAAAIVAHTRAAVPDEGCGLLAGTGSRVEVVYPTANEDASPVSYRVDSRDQWRAMRDAESRGLDVLGCFHSHTHSDAYPSVTDVAQAFYPEWVYVIVGLGESEPVLRAFRIRSGEVVGVPLLVDPE